MTRPQQSEDSAMALTCRVTPEDMAVYRATATRRWHQEQREVAKRRALAWEVATRASRILRAQFGATRVVLFGSLVHEDRFTRWSDVDIAVWGLAPCHTFRAMSAVDIDSDIEVNLVDVETCRSSLVTTIEREGVEL